jgi:NADH-quinone oxidoreductase subunit N
MTTEELLVLSPLLALTATPIVVMLTIAFHRNHRVSAVLTIAGLIITLALLSFSGRAESPEVTALLVLDGYARFFVALIVAAAVAVALLSYGFFDRVKYPEEFYVLLAIATLGSAVLAASRHFVSFFVGLELLSVSLYAMIAYPQRARNQIEASIKYLILAATSGAFLLFGLALVYAATGRMDFATAATAIPQRWLNPQVLFAGWALALVGIGFKLAVVPFQLWTPDVYEGAPAPVAAFVATVSKGAMFALLVRFFVPSGIHHQMPFELIFALVAMASMLFGNLAALLQDNIKRILAYSSIAHMGYLLVAFLAAGDRAIFAVAFYLTAYFVTTLAAFGVMTLLSTEESEADRIADYRGLFWRRPWLGGIMTAALLSLAGVPLTIGFIGKFYLVLAGISSTLWLLVFTLVLSSTIGLFYYLRIIVSIYALAGEPVPALRRFPVSGGAALAILTVLLIGLGIYPTPAIRIIETVVHLF